MRHATFSLKSNTLLSDVQKAFRQAFPHLRLTFFIQPHLICQTKSFNQEIPAHTQVKDISTFKSPGSIELTPGKLVAEFEQHLWTQFGLVAKVIRDVGNHCMQAKTANPKPLERRELSGKNSQAMDSQSEKLKRL